MPALIVLEVGAFILAILALVIFTIVFWIRMIIDCAGREFKNPNDKIIWILIIILFHFLGAVIYWAVIKKSDSALPPK
jgi:nitrate reductase gamma subunit